MRKNTPFVCSIVFLDIVGYSENSASEQIPLKERFNALLSIAISDIPVNERIILETQNGAAISFLGDIEDVLHTALSLRSNLLREKILNAPPLLLRTGINLGSVRLIKDAQGHPNIVGDGINVAQQVMKFAAPGQILCSHTYYEAVSHISPGYAGIFLYGGSHADNNMRKYEVYAIAPPDDLSGTQVKSTLAVHTQNNKLQAALLGWCNAIHAHLREASDEQKTRYIRLAMLPLLLLLAQLVIALADTPKTSPEYTSGATEPDIPFYKSSVVNSTDKSANTHHKF